MIIREKIVKYLGNNNRQSIKQISEGIKAKENIIRSKIYEKPYGLLAKGIVVKVAHIGRRNYFSLKENAPQIDNKETDKGWKQYHILFKKVSELDSFQSISQLKTDILELAVAHLDFELMEKLETEVNE